VDYERLMSFTEELLTTVAREVIGTTEFPFGAHSINMAAPFRRLSLRHAAAEEASKRLGVAVTVDELRSLDSARQIATKLGVEIPKGAGAGKVASAIFEALWEEQLIQPTFVHDFPTEVSPLSKQRADDPDTVERFELYVGGFEVANAFSELNDPVEQRRRFEGQLAERTAGDHEAHVMDEDYVRALEYGMPPAGGEGIGIDRLVMLLSNSTSIRDVILFPLMRPRAEHQEG
jgi:lysyl-tRNA synthetase class 2